MARAGNNGSHRGLSKIDVNALGFVPVWIDMLQVFEWEPVSHAAVRITKAQLWSVMTEACM